MAARYVRIGQHPDYRDEIRGTLSEILASTANPGTYAAPEDVTGTYLEMGADGLWTGASVGYLTKAQADALVASGVMGKVKTGTPAEIGGEHVRWTGTAWQSDLIVGPFTDLSAANAWAAANPSSLFPGLLATAGGVQYRWDGSGWVENIEMDNSDSGPLQSFPLDLTYLGIQIRPGATPSTATDAYIDGASPYYCKETGKYYLLYVGVSQTAGAPGTESIHLAESLTVSGPWTKLGQIITPTGIEGDPDRYGCTGASEPIFNPDDGLYYVYYIGTDATGYEQGNKTICLATSASIYGPYTHEGAKVTGYGSSALTPTAVWHRSIIKRDQTWYMFFNASRGTGGEAIVLATSNSVAGPWVIDASAPILSPTVGKWDSYYVADPCVMLIGDRYVMSYWGGDSGGIAVGGGIATTTPEQFPRGWVKATVNDPWFNSASLGKPQGATLATKPRLLRVGAELYVFFSSNISTILTGIGSGIHLCRIGPRAKGIFPKYKRGSTNYGGAGYSEIGLQVGDFDQLSFADSALAWICSKNSNSYMAIGQSAGNLGFLAWVYNATAASAYLLFDVWGGSNPIILSENAGTAGKQGITIGNNTPAGARSVFDINSTAKGARLPRMTTTQRDAVSWVAGDEGMEIYNLTMHKKQLWTGSAWETITSV